MILRHSAFKSDANYADVLVLARKAKGNDEEGYRSEFIRLVESAKLLVRTEPLQKNDADTDDEEETGSQ